MGNYLTISSQMADEKCCGCIPLETGIKTIAVFTILGTIVFLIQCIQIEDLWALWSPMIAACGVMSLVWVGVLMNPIESSRKLAFLAYIILIVGVTQIYYLTIILNGSAVDHVCEAVEEYQDEIGEYVTTEDCRLGGKNGMLVDCALGWIISIYWAYVILQWSKSDSDYDKQ